MQLGNVVQSGVVLQLFRIVLEALYSLQGGKVWFEPKASDAARCMDVCYQRIAKTFKDCLDFEWGRIDARTSLATGAGMDSN